MGEGTIVYLGVDAAKDKHAVAVAESGRTGEVRYLGEIETTPASVERLVRKLEKKYDRLHVCDEAGPIFHGVHRQITAMGHVCESWRPRWSRSGLANG